ncbi:MAG: NTP transferase domain-containing protein [Thermoanaerobaculia bacterium]
MKMVILAAGQGTRLRETLGPKPKILADLGGETILDRLLAFGRELRLDPVIVARPEHAADLRHVPAEVLVEERPAGLITTLYQTREVFESAGEPFVWVAGDMVFAETGPLRELVENHRPEDFASFLVCRTDRFKAKVRFEPELELAATREGVWALSLPTLAVQSPRLFSFLEGDPERIYPFRSARAAGETFAFRECLPKVFEIDTPADLAEARAHFARCKPCASIS